MPSRTSRALPHTPVPPRPTPAGAGDDAASERLPADDTAELSYDQPTWIALSAPMDARAPTETAKETVVSLDELGSLQGVLGPGDSFGTGPRAVGPPMPAVSAFCGGSDAG